MRPRTPIHSRVCRTAAAAAIAACAIAATAPAAAAPGHKLRLSPLSATSSDSIRLFGAPRAADRFRASVLRARSARRAHAAASQAVLRTADGISIPVALSSAYAPNPAVEQSYVNFLDGLVHGSELSKLSVYIATPAQIENTFCGDGALACYIGDEERIYVPGVDQNSDPPVDFLVAHEYGHHIELNRSNAPWSAFDQGAKYWASYESVCALKRRHRIGTSYYSDPSEAFAESYADMQYPGVDFIYTDLLAPDKGAFKAIRADVLHPWRGPHTVNLHGSLSDHGNATRSFRIRTPPRGSARVDLSAPAGADYRLQVLPDSRAVKRAHPRAGHAAAAAGYTICGARSVTVRVTRISGSGAFTVAASIP